jgi:hypothetical protein
MYFIIFLMIICLFVKGEIHWFLYVYLGVYLILQTLNNYLKQKNEQENKQKELEQKEYEQEINEERKYDKEEYEEYSSLGFSWDSIVGIKKKYHEGMYKYYSEKKEKRKVDERMLDYHSRMFNFFSEEANKLITQRT